MKNILIIDDQPYLPELFSEELRYEGYRSVNIANVESINEHLRNSRTDLVLLDLQLDGLKGWDVLNDIKREHPHLPVLIFTAYDSYVDDPRLSQADGYVVKDFTAFDRLKERMSEVLGANSRSDMGKRE